MDRARGKRAAIATLILVAAGLLAAAPGPIAGTAVVVADLEGSSIAIERIPDYYCHDLDFPAVHCFGSEAALRTSLGQRQTSSAPRGQLSSGEQAVLALTYVTMYRDETLAGTYFQVSQAYDNLGTIGWNDLMSSFRALNGIAGHFAEHSFGSGLQYPFGANQVVYYVGDGFNDRASSVYPW